MIVYIYEILIITMQNLLRKIIKSKKRLNCKDEENFRNLFHLFFILKNSYEKSGTQTTEVRRMFLERKDMTGYKAYTAKQNDP
jgi:hypothetical protein